MSYMSAVNKLSTLSPKVSSKFRYKQEFSDLLSFLGNPHRSCKFIHVTGTNGKGSVALKVAKVLEEAGLKTGLYTSPHLFSFTQRIQINSTKIPQSYFSKKFWEINLISNTYNLGLNFFECITAIAFCYFREQKCDYVSLQVGMGGQHDSTNIIDPCLSIITSIGLDHTDVLGKTLSEIAVEKSGIIKKNKPVVVGANCNPIEVFERKCREMNSALYKIEQPQNADFNVQNNNIVKKAMEILVNNQPGLKGRIRQEHILKGLEANPQCRMEILQRHIVPNKLKNNFKSVVFDVGHNPPALNKLCESLRERYRDRNIVFVYGASSKKDSQHSIQELTPLSDKIYIVEAKHSRAMPIEKLKEIGQKQQFKNIVKMHQNGDITQTIDHVLNNQKQGDVLVICGSFFIMEQAKGYFSPLVFEESDNRMISQFRTTFNNTNSNKYTYQYFKNNSTYQMIQSMIF